MEKNNVRYSCRRINIDSLLNNDINIEVRRLSPIEYIVVISMIIASLYLLVTSFFPLVYNIVTSFEPVDFLINLFYFILGISVMIGAFLIFKKETHLEHIADDIFDRVVYKRLEPVLRDVAEVQVGLANIHNKLEMMNHNIQKIRTLGEHATPAISSEEISMYIKYVVLINITLAVFLFMLRYQQEYVRYSVTVLYIIWWAIITHEFKLYDVESVWMWIFIPVLILPVYTIIQLVQ